MKEVRYEEDPLLVSRCVEEQRGLNEIKEKAQMETIDLLEKELAEETEKVRDNGIILLDFITN